VTATVTNTPDLIALLVCESIVRDMTTGCPTLVNVFQRITCPVLPIYQRVHCFARLANGEGHQTFKFKVVELETGDVISETTLEEEWRPERDFLDLYCMFGSLPILHYGYYEFLLYADDLGMGRSKVRVIP
jgi:hypothetical protein